MPINNYLQRPRLHGRGVPVVDGRAQLRRPRGGHQVDRRHHDVRVEVGRHAVLGAAEGLQHPLHLHLDVVVAVAVVDLAVGEGLAEDLWGEKKGG